MTSDVLLLVVVLCGGLVISMIGIYFVMWFLMECVFGRKHAGRFYKGVHWSYWLFHDE